MEVEYYDNTIDKTIRVDCVFKVNDKPYIFLEAKKLDRKYLS